MTDLMSGQLLISALVLGGIYGLIALGLNLIYGTMRLLNVAHGEVLMLGGYLAFWLFTLTGIGPIYSMFIAFALGGALGAILYYFVCKRVLKSSKVIEQIEANSLLVLFGASIIFQNIIAFAFTPTARGYSYFNDIIQFGAFQVTTGRLFVLVTGLSVCLISILFFRYSMIGLSIRALIQQPDAANLVGINVEKTRLVSFSLGFAIAGLTGCLVSMLEQVSLFMGFPFTIAAFVVIIIGGLGNLAGGLAGAFLLAFIEVYGVVLTTASMRSILIYGVFIAVLIWRPKGIFGKERGIK